MKPITIVLYTAQWRRKQIFLALNNNLGSGFWNNAIFKVKFKRFL